jgi:hypothetical protein
MRPPEMLESLDPTGRVSRHAEPADGDNRNFLLAVLVLIVGAWTVTLRSSLWLDETGTYWVIQGGLRQTFHRAVQFGGPSPVYYVIEWAARSVMGRSELVLRLPSFAALAVATYLLFRLARRLFDRETALLAAVCFASFGPILSEASDARPYAFALAALIGSTLALARWLDDGRTLDGVVYVVAAALTLYFQYLFAIPLLVHVGYAIRRRQQGTAVSDARLVAAALSLVVLVIPLVPLVASLFERRQSLTFPVDTSLKALFFSLVPPVLVAALVGWFLVVMQAGVLHSRPANADPASFLMVLGLWLAPPVVLFVGARLLSSSLFADRYLLAAAPGIGLAAGWVLGRVPTAFARRWIAVAVVAASLASYGSVLQHDEDWRGAITAVNELTRDPRTPVLFNGGFVESLQIGWLTDPEKSSYLDAPLAYYPMKGRVIPLPATLTTDGVRYLSGVTSQVLTSSRRFLLVTRFLAPFREWLEGRLRPLGFTDRPVGHYGVITVTLFERPGASA